MFRYSEKSLSKLSTVDKQLQDLMNEVIKITPIDFSIIETSRSQARQQELYDKGLTKTLKSKHIENKAVDIVCCKEKYKEPLRDIYIVIGIIIAKAKEMNIPIKVGTLWNENSTLDNKFIDAFHIELDN